MVQTFYVVVEFIFSIILMNIIIVICAIFGIYSMYMYVFLPLLGICAFVSLYDGD